MSSQNSYGEILISDVMMGRRGPLEGPEESKESRSGRENTYSGDRLIRVQIPALAKVICGVRSWQSDYFREMGCGRDRAMNNGDVLFLTCLVVSGICLLCENPSDSTYCLSELSVPHLRKIKKKNTYIHIYPKGLSLKEYI